MDGTIRDETLIERDILLFLSIVLDRRSFPFSDQQRTNQLSPFSDKDLVDLCFRIEPYQVMKNHYFNRFAVCD
jgi:hypothetical protein